MPLSFWINEDGVHAVDSLITFVEVESVSWHVGMQQYSFSMCIEAFTNVSQVNVLTHKYICVCIVEACICMFVCANVCV